MRRDLGEEAREFGFCGRTCDDWRQTSAGGKDIEYVIRAWLCGIRPEAIRAQRPDFHLSQVYAVDSSIPCSK